MLHETDMSTRKALESHHLHCSHVHTPCTIGGHALHGLKIEALMSFIKMTKRHTVCIQLTCRVGMCKKSYNTAVQPCLLSSRILSIAVLISLFIFSRMP